MSLCAFIASLIGLFIPVYGVVVEIAALVLSIVGVVFANKKRLQLKGLGIAGIAISGAVIFFMLIALTGWSTVY